MAERHSLVNQISTLDHAIYCYDKILKEPHVDARMTEYHKRVLEAARATLAFMHENETIIREAIALDRKSRDE